jgi:hypothetical protein
MLSLRKVLMIHSSSLFCHKKNSRNDFEFCTVRDFVYTIHRDRMAIDIADSDSDIDWREMALDTVAPQQMRER